jgi:ferric-dicitrate binding protein FerR (iron transport regulator)
MAPSYRLQELFSRYLQRRCTAAEVEELTGLLQQADAEEVLTEPMRALWEELRVSRTEHSVDWDKMYERISRTEEDLYTLNRRRQKSFHIGRRAGGWVAAAAVLLVLATTAYWALSRRRTDERKEVAVAPVAANPGMAVPAAARRRVIHLPDGSMVILNKNSQLDYPAAFAGKTREVRLSGEAYFDITHMNGRPFLVRTGKVTTRVLGTAFNIKAYPADADIEVTVTHGKVQVLKENTSMGLLTDDQQIRFDKGTEGFVRKKIDIRPVVAWKPEEIRYDDITMQEAARQIEERFKVAVVFNNPVLKDCRVTATFYEDDGLDEIMTVICVVSQSHFTIQDHRITIDGRGCN